MYNSPVAFIAVANIKLQVYITKKPENATMKSKQILNITTFMESTKKNSVIL